MVYCYYSYELASRMVCSANYENMAINYSNTNCDRLHSGLEVERMITIDLDSKFAIVSDGEVIKLVQKDGRKKANAVLHRD